MNCRIRILKVLRCIYSRYKSYPGPNHGTFRFLSRWPVAAYGSRQMTGSLDGSLLSINVGRILRHDRQVPIVDGYIHIYLYIYIYHVISLENPLKNLKSPHDILIRNHGHPAPGEFKHSWGTAEKLYKSEVRWDSDSYGVDHSDQRAEVSWEAALETKLHLGPLNMSGNGGPLLFLLEVKIALFSGKANADAGVFFRGELSTVQTICGWWGPALPESSYGVPTPAQQISG